MFFKNALLFLLLSHVPLFAAEKSDATLFHPVPAGEMREFSPDRPDKTEGPFTVDAGHLQLEMDLAHFTRNRADGGATRTWNVAPANFRIGLLENTELDLIYDSYVHEKVTGNGGSTRSGVGDLTVRLKTNLWGNDGGASAFALLPFLRIPTSSAGLGNDGLEGGLILPLAIELPGGWDLGLMTEADILRNEEDSGYHAELVNSITCSHDIVGKLAGYVEFFSSVSTENGSTWIGTLDLGLTYGVTENIALDAGCNIGLTKSADDLDPFVGLSMRF